MYHNVAVCNTKMGYSAKVLVRWKHVVTVIPSLKYFYVYSHHCTAVSNHHSSNCRSQGTEIVKPDKKTSSLACFKFHRDGLADPSIYYLSALKNRHLKHNLHIHEQSSLLNCGAKHKNTKQSSYYLQNSILKDNKSIENILFGDSVLLPLVDNLQLCHNCNSSKIVNFYNNSFDKEPADDPKQKLRMLSEKLRVEAPMFLGKTKPYHDFSIYTDAIELEVENSPKKVRSWPSGLRWYKIAVGLYRRLQRFRLLNPELEVLGIRVGDDHNTIEVRWRVCGWTRFDLLYAYLFQSAVNQNYYDYNSVLYVNDSGLIWRHKVSKMKTHQNSVPLKHKLQNFNQNTMGAFNAMKTSTTLHNKRAGFQT